MNFVIPGFGTQLAAKQLSLDGQALYGLTRNPAKTNNGVLCTPLDTGFRWYDVGII